MLRFRAFKGMLPSVDPTLLPDGFAQVCENARMRNGALVPFRNVLTTDNLPVAKASITKVSGYWRGYAARASVVQGPVVESRAYVSGDGAPRVESYDPLDTFSYALALPRPVSAPTVALHAGSVDPDIKESVVFVYTWLTELDEESAPSALSAAIDYSPGATIRINGFASTPASRGITHRRIYRSVTDYAGVATLFYIGEITVATTLFDYSSSVAVAEPIPTTDYDTPDANIKGFTAMPNGIVAGFYGRKLWFCEPYRPHAWPIKYELTTDYDIVGLAAFGSSLAVMTTGTPYLATGLHPENMALQKIEQNLPCVSAAGIVDLGYAAAYPSYDGLVTISEAGAQLVTAAMFSRDDWNLLKPTTFVASHYEGRYVMLHRPDLDEPAVIGMIDLTGQSPFFITMTGTGLDLYHEIELGALYILNTNGTAIQRVDDAANTTMTFTWRSKIIPLPGLVNIAWIRVDAHAGSGSVTARLYGNGATLIHEAASITIGAPVRLPSGRLDDTFELEITGTREVYNVGLGNDVTALAG